MKIAEVMFKTLLKKKKGDAVKRRHNDAVDDRLVDRAFEIGTCLELNHFLCCDCDGFFGSRIDALSFWSLLYGNGTKSDE